MNMIIYNNDQLEALAKNYYEMFNNKFMYEEEFNRWEDLTNCGNREIPTKIIKLIIMLAESTIDLIEFDGKIQNEFDINFIGFDNEEKILAWAEAIDDYINNGGGKEHIQSIKAKTIVA